MGYVKRRLMDQLDRERRQGYCAPNGRFVCPSCVTDKFLSDALRNESGSHICSYCRVNKGATIGVLLDEVRDAIYENYADPADELPHDSSDGGYQGSVIDTDDLFDSVLDEWTQCDELRNDVIAAFSKNDWCKKNYFAADGYQRLRYGWDRFVHEIKCHARYLFFDDADRYRDLRDQDTISPAQMMDELGKLFRDLGLFGELKKGDECIRARVVARGEYPSSAEELGTPPRELAKYSNRMSPAGIPMFYAAFDDKTAFLETYDPKGDRSDIVLARFRATRTLRVLDITSLPELPSCFDRENRGKLDPIRFLYSLRCDLAEPITKDGFEHVDYVPTQVITEYVRHRLRNNENEKIDGILYPSSKRGGGNAVVIFAENRECGPRGKQIEDSEPLLDLVDYRYADSADFVSMEELAHSQNIGRIANVEELAGTWPGEENDGFEVSIDELRHRIREQ